MTQDDTGATLQADMVTIKLPAAGAYLSVLRTATAGLAARLDFTLDEIEDLRIAVDEACAMLLAQAVPGADLDCTFTLNGDSMRVERERADTRRPAALPRHLRLDRSLGAGRRGGQRSRRR